MILKELKPKKALNKAFLKVKPNRTEIEGFKENLITLLERTNDIESEGFHKNLIIDFLNKTYYDPNHYINTKGRNDLVIHNGSDAGSTVGVIIETKKPTNRTEMVTAKKLNVKAFQELVFYYLRERITLKNLEIKHLIVTNINEWFIFDATLFERLFAQDKNLLKKFSDFEGGRLADNKTEFFYKEIAAPFIETIKEEIEFTYFNIQDYQKPLRNNDKSDDHSLIALFKLLSPEHLLKLPFANDSNSLDKRFYNELLHIIGLAETKEGSKKIIGRGTKDGRHSGTILENTIIQLDSLDKINRIDNANQYGSSHQERLFNVGIELTITWLNRILFLKLLEAQLIAYNKGNKSYSFLNLDKIKNYDDLNGLFFQVLARRIESRTDDVRKEFEKVPYLNSSLFEPTELEQQTLFISNLKDDKTIPLFSQTVLKDQKGKKLEGTISTLQYLFKFLDTYDFGSEGAEEIQEDNKTLINASVLGLIFEKINGYKDGSFFTPGFITMFMCRETIRKAVVQKFNEVKNWNCKNIEELYDKIEDRKEANEIVNSIKICDPAVGSGHFLVSALNEMIAVKNDLKILQDREGKRLKEYHAQVVSDELIVTDEDGELFKYHPNNKESQRIQETLFHEKQTIIENCLFGVDINSNSVKICRLRLWIELLKNAYYKNDTELETLPNIDINIKCGNSLISRFAIDSDLKQVLRKSKRTIKSYRSAVESYRNAKTKEQKREMEQLINDIKSDFKIEISNNDTKVNKLRKITGELNQMYNQIQLFEKSKKEQSAWNKKILDLTKESKKLYSEIEELKSNKIYENAFEWRFEFPEVLNDEGTFIGFDVIIGNPPYGVKLSGNEKQYIKNSLFNSGETAILFIYKGRELLNENGKQSYIIPKSFTYASNYSDIREVLKDEISLIVDCGKPWLEVKLEACIFQIEKNLNIDKYTSLMVNEDKFVYLTETPKSLIDEFGFILNGITEKEIELAKKIKKGNLYFGDISINKRGAGLQTSILSEGKYKVIGGIDIARYEIKNSIRGYYDDISMNDRIGLVQNNSVLVQNIVAHLTKPVGHIKIIAALPPDKKEEYIILDTINQIVFRDDVSSNFGCQLLNSKLINWYVYNFIYAKAIRTMHFDNVVTNRIPFPNKYFSIMVSLDNSITDTDIYSLFDLEPFEINLIEQTFN